MEIYLLTLLTLSATWGHSIFPDNVLESGEEDVSGTRHRQVREEDERRLLGSFSTRPNYSKNKSPEKFNLLTFSSRQTPSAYSESFTDTFWKNQWYQLDKRVTDGPVMDHNIVPAQRMGYDGKGIKIAILGDSLDFQLFDMKDRVIDIFNAIEDSKSEKKEKSSWYSVAPKVAGVIAMNVNNSLCGAGIAFNSQIIGITVSEDDIKKNYDKYIIKGMKYSVNSIDMHVDAIVKNHDGMSAPFNKAIFDSLADIAYRGRRKKGGIYVVGSGNGREKDDNCATDYIANSIHTFVIGSADSYGKQPKYSESCSAIIATAYSTRVVDKKDQCVLGIPGPDSEGVVTIYSIDTCTTKFGGTLASAAIASGIFALTLQANPDLTWRDVMHITAMSSEKAPLFKNLGWKLNGGGFYVSHQFGFGLLNAENMVLNSKNWNTVPKMITCKLKFTDFGRLNPGEKLSSTLKVESCPSIDKNSKEALKYIEQVELITSFSYFNRGAISIWLDSPSGTQTILLQKRRYDDSKNGFKNRRFRSLHFWGEQPFGKWSLTYHAEIQDKYEDNGCLSALILRLSEPIIRVGSMGLIGDQVRKAELLIHGTSDAPKHYQKSSPHRLYAYSPNVKRAFYGDLEIERD